MQSRVGSAIVRGLHATAVAVFSLILAPAEARQRGDDEPAIAATKGVIVREGDRLVIHTKSGKAVTLADGPSCWEHANADRCVGHAFLRHDWARGLFVIERYYYEGADHILIDGRTGDMTLMQADPSLSPMGDVALELVYGESHYYAGRPTLNVWRRVGGRFKREWSMPIDGDYYSVLGWRSNDRIDIEETIQRPGWIVEGGQRTSADAGTRRMSLIREGRRWRIEKGPLPTSDN